MSITKTYRVIGLMSGSSLDGLDICYASITTGNIFSFNIIAAATIPFTEEEKKYLRSIPADMHFNYTEAHQYFAALSASLTEVFIVKNEILEIDFIATHGHTIFHYPAKGVTCQITNGRLLSDLTGQEVICNFRQADIDAGGQGAPLVPICDELFFTAYDACLNIGGIANISYRIDERIGFDICAANQLLNYCAAKAGFEFDDQGKFARNGKVDEYLLEQLNNHAYFLKSPPKSLDNNEIRAEWLPLLHADDISVADQLATVSYHIAQQISAAIKEHIINTEKAANDYRLLVTGGGAFNTFLVEQIATLSGIDIALPMPDIIRFKEALAICLMGVLRKENVPNFIPSVTGAHLAVCGGDIFNKKMHIANEH